MNTQPNFLQLCLAKVQTHGGAPRNPEMITTSVQELFSEDGLATYTMSNFNINMATEQVGCNLLMGIRPPTVYLLNLTAGDSFFNYEILYGHATMASAKKLWNCIDDTEKMRDFKRILVTRNIDIVIFHSSVQRDEAVMLIGNYLTNP